MAICKFIYRIEQNFGGEKTLANLANRHNSPSFFANIPDEARKCRQALDSPKFFPPMFQNHNFAKFFYRQSFVLYGNIEITIIVKKHAPMLV